MTYSDKPSLFLKVEYDLLNDPAGQYKTSAPSQVIQHLEQHGGFAVKGHIGIGLIGSSVEIIGIAVIACADRPPL